MWSHRLFRGAAILLLGGAVALRAPHPAPPPDLVLGGGKIFTADSARPWAEALAIAGERIVAVGSNAEIARLAGPATRRLDLGCQVVNGVRVSTSSDDPFADPSLAVVSDSLRALAVRLPAGTWIGAYIGGALLADTTARRRVLDELAPRHPVWLTAFTGHGAIGNTLALRALGISDTASDPVGGRYEREPGTRRVTGMLEEYAAFAANRRQCSMVPESTLVAALRTTGEQLVRLGITSVQSMTNELEPALLLRVFRAAALPLRVRLIATPMSTPAGRNLAEWDAELAGSRPAPNDNGGTLVVSGLKWILDGTPIDRLQFMRAVYRDRPGWYGQLDFPADTIRAMLLEARARGQQPVLHAGGDSAIAVVLGGLERTGGAAAWARLRVRIEHFDGLGRDQFAAARRLGVVLVQNPTHLMAHPVFTARFGPAVRATYAPLRSVLEAGIPLALGSDGPTNPFLNIMMATTYERRPAEALTRAQAVIAYTRGAAFAEGVEGEKGRLAPGMLADLAVLSQDIFTVGPATLPATASVLTLVGGRIVYDGRDAGHEE